tara:strand:- start:2959 stop:3162 length:204 start_codon:yes stop_codon:yes gene_type:complete
VDHQHGVPEGPVIQRNGVFHMQAGHLVAPLFGARQREALRIHRTEKSRRGPKAGRDSFLAHDIGRDF